MKYPMKSFRPNQTVLEMMEEIEYGQRSQWVNRCCEKHGEEALKELQTTTNFPAQSTNSENSQNKQTPYSEFNKQSKDTAATENKPTETSSTKPNILKQFLQSTQFGRK